MPMLASVAAPSADVLLVLFGVQVAMTAAFAAALVGLAVRLAHPLMRALALLWMVRLGFHLVGYALLWTGDRTSWWAFVGAFTIGALAATVIPIGACITTCAVDPPTTRLQIPWRPYALAGGVATLTVHLTNVQRFGASELITIGWTRGLLLVVYGTVLVFLLRARRHVPARHRLAPLIVAVFSGLVFSLIDGWFRMRQVRAQGGELDGLIAALCIITGTLLFGVCSLLAAIESERDAIAASAERLRVAALQAATAERLQSLGRLAGGVAHDFNNILGVVLAGVDLASAALPDVESPPRRELRDVRAAALRGAELTRRLLGFAKRQSDQAESCTPSATVRDLLPMLERLMTGGVRLEAAARGQYRIALDVVRFEQVVLNLVLNARDAMPDGGCVRLTLEDVQGVESRPARIGRLEPGAYVRLEIADTGIGIPADLLPTIFEEFVSTKGAQGTGLGLATVAAVIGEVQGALDVESAPGHTVFRVWFPVRPPSVPHTGANGTASAALAVTGTDSAGSSGSAT